MWRCKPGDLFCPGSVWLSEGCDNSERSRRQGEESQNLGTSKIGDSV